MTITRQPITVHIRWMIQRDMPEVLAIEDLCFEHAWSEETFVNYLRQRNTIGMVAEYKEKTVGFMVYELYKTRLHLANLAVLPGRWMEGIGRQMVNRLIDKLSPHRRARITTLIRETNLPAQLFFKRCGFEATDVLKNYYAETDEDAYVMECRKYQEPN